MTEAMKFKEVGMACALASAFLWAVVPIMYRRLGDEVAPIAINLGKGLIATLIFGIMLLFGDGEPVAGRTILLLAVSGILGISLGDTFYFKCLLRLGPRLSLVITMLIPVMTMLLGMAILKESFSSSCWVGTFLTLAGVLLVLWDHTTVAGEKGLKSGLVYGALTVLCCASAVISAKMALVATSALKATFIRQLTGVTGLVLWGGASRCLKSWLAPFRADANLLKRLIFASFLGTFLGTWFCLLALKHADAGIATTLNATSPLFILPLSFFLLKEKITVGAVLGSVTGVIGVALLFMGG